MDKRRLLELAGVPIRESLDDEIKAKEAQVAKSVDELVNALKKLENVPLEQILNSVDKFVEDQLHKIQPQDPNKKP